MTLLVALSTGLFAGLVVLIWRRFRYRPGGERWFLHENGRILVLRGVNVCGAAKADPLRMGGTTRQDFQRLSAAGYNAVRLLVFWAGLEPRPGEYDPDYLERLRQRLDWCLEAGLRVVLDFHQDLYAARFGGDGAPEWAIVDDGRPFVHQDRWELNYVQPAVRRAIENFWLDERAHPELRLAYRRAAVHLVSTLGGHPAVLGLDLYNEPTLVGRRGLGFEHRVLTRFYQELIDDLRAVAPDLWIFFEPSALGPNQGFRSGLGRLVDPRPGEPRLVYFPHVYTLDLDLSGRYAGWPIHLDFWAAMRQREAQRWRVPLMVGEFGLDEAKPGALDYLREATARFDAIASGWFYWSYDSDSWGLYRQDGTPRDKAAVLDRPYPREIAGTSPRWRFDPQGRWFELAYLGEGGLGPTTVYLPPAFRTPGSRVEVLAGEVSHRAEGALLVVDAAPGPVSLRVHEGERP